MASRRQLARHCRLFAGLGLEASERCARLAALLGRTKATRPHSQLALDFRDTFRVAAEAFSDLAASLDDATPTTPPTDSDIRKSQPRLMPVEKP